jgi:hypothetical protein
LNPLDFDEYRRSRRRLAKEKAQPPPLPTKKNLPPWEHESASIQAPIPGEDEDTQILADGTDENSRENLIKLCWLFLGMVTGTAAVLLSITMACWS